MPVARPVRALEHAAQAAAAIPLPRGPVAVAAGGLAACAVLSRVQALARRRGAGARPPAARTAPHVVGTRSFLVDVHVLGRDGRRRSFLVDVHLRSAAG